MQSWVHNSQLWVFYLLGQRYICNSFSLMAVFQWDRFWHFVVYGVVSLYWIVISSKMPYVHCLKYHSCCSLLGSGLSCLISRIFELWHTYSQQHRNHCKSVSSLLGWAPISYSKQWLGPGLGDSEGLEGLEAMHEEGERGGMARLWTLIFRCWDRAYTLPGRSPCCRPTCSLVLSKFGESLLLMQDFSVLGLGLKYAHRRILACLTCLLFTSNQTTITIYNYCNLQFALESTVKVSVGKQSRR